MVTIALPYFQRERIRALAEEPVEDDGVGEGGAGAEGKALGVGPLEERDEIFGGEGPGAREAEETRCPGGGSGVALAEEAMG